jgi:hypothetical protein
MRQSRGVGGGWDLSVEGRIVLQLMGSGGDESHAWVNLKPSHPRCQGVSELTPFWGDSSRTLISRWILVPTF